MSHIQGHACTPLHQIFASPSVSMSSIERRWSDTTPYSSKKKLQSWFQLPNGDWELGKMITTSGNESIISLSDGKVLKVKEESLVPANPDILDGVDDLMQLSYLNELFYTTCNIDTIKT